MSLLMFVQQADRVTVFTDTLATDERGNAYMYVTKCWPIPHMRTLVAATGSATLLNEWVEFIRTSILAKDIVNLDQHTPAALRSLWEEMRAEHAEHGITGTIYHFGLDPTTGQAVRFTYRSDSDFESERVDETGIGCRPPLSDMNKIAGLSGFVEIAEAIRAEQDAQAAPERIHIGGDLNATTITAEGIHIETIHRFDDWGEDWNAMCTAAEQP